MEKKLLNMISKYFKKEDYPCLFEQFVRFSKTKPLKGIRILNSTPVFKNFLPKLLPLIASGAHLTVGRPVNLPHDPAIVDFLETLGIPIYTDAKNSEYDIILDCLGSKAHLAAKIGYVELTQSGKQYYLQQKHQKPCYLVDESKVKEIEDLLGTSDGFIRGLENMGINDFTNAKVVLFGYGKVGKGIAYRLTSKGAEITIVELSSKIKEIHKYKTVAAHQISVVGKLVQASDIVVTATGLSNLITDSYAIAPFLSGEKILVNMGAEDEYGTSFDDKRKLNNKHPLNFSLMEPTRLVFLDPIFE